MKVVLTDGQTIFDHCEINDPQDYHNLNALLATRRFNTATGWLEWQPETPERATWPLAPLAKRAGVAYAVQSAQAEHQAQRLRTEELQRQRSELQRLMLAVLGEPIEETSIEIVPAQSAPTSSIDPYHHPEAQLQVTVSGLTFRLGQSSAGYTLELGLACSACGERSWCTISSLVELGAVLPAQRDEAAVNAETAENTGYAELAAPDSTCPTCRRLHEIESDPSTMNDTLFGTWN